MATEEEIMRAFLMQSGGLVSDPWSPVMPVGDFPPREEDLRLFQERMRPLVPREEFQTFERRIAPPPSRGMEKEKGEEEEKRDPTPVQNDPITWGLRDTVEGYQGLKGLGRDPLEDLYRRQMLEERENNMIMQHLFERRT